MNSQSNNSHMELMPVLFVPMDDSTTHTTTSQNPVDWSMGSCDYGYTQQQQVGNWNGNQNYTYQQQLLLQQQQVLMAQQMMLAQSGMYQQQEPAYAPAQRQKKVLSIVSAKTHEPIDKEEAKAPSPKEDVRSEAETLTIHDDAASACSGISTQLPSMSWSDLCDDEDEDEGEELSEADRLKQLRASIEDLCQDNNKAAAAGRISTAVAKWMTEESAPKVARTVWSRVMHDDTSLPAMVELATKFWPLETAPGAKFRASLLGMCQQEFFKACEVTAPQENSARRVMMLNAKLVGGLFTARLLSGPALVKATDEVVTRACNLTVSRVSSMAATDCLFTLITAAGKRLDESESGKKWLDAWMHKLSVSTWPHLKAASSTLEASRTRGFAPAPAPAPEPVKKPFAKKPFHKAGDNKKWVARR